MDVGCETSCKILNLGKNASLHIDDIYCVSICQHFKLQFENINFIFADEFVGLFFKGKVLKDVDVLLSTAQLLYDSNDYKRAFDFFSNAAELGNPVAQQKIGQMYLRGLGVNLDSVQAAEWFRKAAEQGLATAQGCLGVLYETGIGVEQDYAEAVKWYRKAAAQGNENAKNKLKELDMII